MVSLPAQAAVSVTARASGNPDFQARGLIWRHCRESGSPEVRSHKIKLDCCPAQE